MKRKALALILCLVVILTVALPGTLAVSMDTQTTTSTVTVGSKSKTAPQPTTEPPATTEATETTPEPPANQGENTDNETPEPSTPETTVPETTVPETTEPQCNCGATDGNHVETCPLYVKPEEEKELTLFEKLMATKSAAEFDAIIAECTEDQLVFGCAEFDQLNDHYIYLTTGAYPSHEPIVEEVSTTVNFTNVAPLVGSGK